MSPRVSVIIPTYNQADTVTQAIRSVLAQSWHDFEVIVVDDGSTDMTRQAVTLLQDERVRYIYQENQERSRARNNGIRRARGALIAFLDSDDYWEPDYLQHQVANLDASPDLAMSHTLVHDVDETGRRLRIGGAGIAAASSQSDFRCRLVVANRIATPGCVVVRRDVLDAVGLFDPAINQVEDWDLWLRIALRFPVGGVSKPLVNYRHTNDFMPARYARRNALAGHFRTLDKTFAALEDAELLALKGQAYSRGYWRGAWIAYGLGRVEDGKVWLGRARALWPKQFDPPHDALVRKIAHWADELYDVRTPLDEGLAFIDRLMANLPTWADGLRRLNRPIKGYFAALNVFRTHDQRLSAPILPAARAAIRYQPRWLLNAGFVSICRQHLYQGVAAK